MSRGWKSNEQQLFVRKMLQKALNQIRPRLPEEGAVYYLRRLAEVAHVVGDDPSLTESLKLLRSFVAEDALNSIVKKRDSGYWKWEYQTYEKNMRLLREWSEKDIHLKYALAGEIEKALESVEALPIDDRDKAARRAEVAAIHALLDYRTAWDNACAEMNTDSKKGYYSEVCLDAIAVEAARAGDFQLACNAAEELVGYWGSRDFVHDYLAIALGAADYAPWIGFPLYDY